jgi:hypothetical protein
MHRGGCTEEAAPRRPPTAHYHAKVPWTAV